MHDAQFLLLFGAIARRGTAGKVVAALAGCSIIWAFSGNGLVRPVARLRDPE